MTGSARAPGRNRPREPAEKVDGEIAPGAIGWLDRLPPEDGWCELRTVRHVTQALDQLEVPAEAGRQRALAQLQLAGYWVGQWWLIEFAQRDRRNRSAA